MWCSGDYVLLHVLFPFSKNIFSDLDSENRLPHIDVREIEETFICTALRKASDNINCLILVEHIAF